MINIINTERRFYITIMIYMFAAGKIAFWHRQILGDARLWFHQLGAYGAKWLFP